MKNTLTKVILIVFLCNLYFSSSKCQNLSDRNIPPSLAHQVIKIEYGFDPVLVNGDFYEDYYRNDLEHPFLFDENFQKGYLVIHNKKYDNLELKYDVYKQNIVIYASLKQGTQVAFIPPVEYVSEFSLGNAIFQKYSFADGKSHFYQEVYSGKIKCLYSWMKGRERSDHIAQYVAYKFTGPKRRSFLVIDEVLYQYRNKAGFLKLFPEEIRKDLSGYIKTHEIKLTDSSDEKISDLLSFCEILLLQIHLVSITE